MITDLGNTKQDCRGLWILVNRMFCNPQANLGNEVDTARTPKQIEGIRHFLKAQACFKKVSFFVRQ